MKLYLACAVLFCLLLPAGAQETGKPSAADILDRVRPSVVKLSVVDAKKQKSSGSGVFLTANGQILTCYHVIANAKTVVANLADGTTAKVTGVVAFSASQDWAVVQSDARDAVPAPRGKLSALRQGDRIYTLGAPLGLDLTASDGMVSSIRKIDGAGTFLQITAPISKGSSGGPLLNSSGEVVGITAFILTEGNNLNFAVAINNVESAWTGKEKPRPFAHAAKTVNEPRSKVGNQTSDTTSSIRTVAEICAKAFALMPPDNHAPGAKEAIAKALPLFLQAKRLVPYDHIIITIIGICYHELGRTDEAIEEYRTAIRLSPDDVFAHHNLGCALSDKGLTDEAIKEYRTAIRLAPDDAIAHINLGVALSAKGLADEAIEEYRTAIRLSPDDVFAHHNLGIALGAKGLTDEAIKEFRTAIELAPDYAIAHYNLGAALGSKSLTDEAIKEFRTAIRLAPDDADAHYLLGISFILAGNRSAALYEYAILKRLNTDLANRLFDIIYPPER